jgi:hypothetical protein
MEVRPVLVVQKHVLADRFRFKQCEKKFLDLWQVLAVIDEEIKSAISVHKTDESVLFL